LACLKADSYQKLPQMMRTALESLAKRIPQSSEKRNYKYIRWVKAFLRIASLPRLERSMIIGNSALSEDAFQNFFINPINYRESNYVKRYRELYDEFPETSYLTKMCYTNTKTYLTDHNLAYSDKAMMAAGVEGRPPLIDHRIVELMFRLNDGFRIKKNTQKFLLKKVAEKYLPPEIIYRPKAPFSAPMRGWLKIELKEMVNDILSYESLRKRGFYNPEYVQKLVKDNDSGLEDNSQLIWRLMVNEIWFRTFFD
jgi:asparagine synthase (glutamine-hydrolysing)